MKIILLGPIAAWQLYAVGSVFAAVLIVAVVFIFQYIRKNGRKK